MKPEEYEGEQIDPRWEMWRCVGCGETFDEPRLSHGVAGHTPGCDGSCRNCPVEIECGPIEKCAPEVKP